LNTNFTSTVAGGLNKKTKMVMKTIMKRSLRAIKNFQFTPWAGDVFLLLTSQSIVAQHSDTARFNRHRHPFEGWHGIPNLTDDQKKKIHDLKTPFSKEVLPLSNQLSEKRAHLKTLETAEKTDLNAINSTIDEISQLQAQLMKKRAAHTQSIRKLLTDDQRIAFDMKSSSGQGFPQNHRTRNHHGRRG